MSVRFTRRSADLWSCASCALLAVLLLLAGLGPAFADRAQPVESHAPGAVDESVLDKSLRAPVVVDGVPLFHLRGVSARPAAERAQIVAERIVALARDPSFAKSSLAIDARDEVTLIMAGRRLVVSLGDGDAHLEGVDRQTLAEAVLFRVGSAIDDWRNDRTPQTLRRHGAIALGATVALALLLWGGTRALRALEGALDRHLQSHITDVRILSFRLFSARNVWRGLGAALRLAWVATVLVAASVYLTTVLGLFPWTRWLAVDVLALVLDPLQTLGLGLLRSLPDLSFLVVLFFVTRYLLKLVKLFFEGVASGSTRLPDFDPDWAWPTYRIIRLLAIVFALIVAYPYIPGSGSDAFKGVSLFVGVLFSLGSSSLIGNVIAGYTMTYRRMFKVGDRVTIGAHTGTVEQLRMLVTHLRTARNELVAIPNSVILNAEVVNYSTLSRERGLIVHVAVGVGYDTPWRQVEAILLEAAKRTEGLLREPAPFARLADLGEFCIRYELNAYCADPHAMERVRAALRRSALDAFNEYGVPLMIPSYEGDPERPKVVPPDRWYAAPARRP